MHIKSAVPAAFAAVAVARNAAINVDDAHALLRDKFAPWVQELGLVVEACAPEGARLRMPWTPKLARFGNTLCGQAMLAAADSAMAIGITAAFGRFQNVTTVSQTMNFMRAIPEGDVIVEATVRKLGRSLVFAEASFRGAAQEAICAQAVSTWAVIA